MPQCDAQPGIDDELDEQQEQPKKRDFKEVNANRTATKMAAALGVSRADYERWKPGKKAAAVMAKAEPVKAHGGQREGAGRKAEVKEDNQGSESTLIEEPKKQKRDSAYLAARIKRDRPNMTKTKSARNSHPANWLREPGNLSPSQEGSRARHAHSNYLGMVLF